MSARGTIGSTVFLLALLAGGGVAVAAGFGPGTGFDRPVVPKPSISASAETVEAGGTFDVIADFELTDKVKLYREKLQFTWTKLEGAKFQGLVLPEPELARDPITERNVPVYTKKAKVIGRLIATGKEGDGIVVEGALQHQSCTDQTCFLPMEESFRFELVTTPVVAGTPAAEPPQVTPLASADETTPLFAAKHTHFLLRMLLAFVIGLGLALTPCVYPTIPIAAAVVGGRKERGLVPALIASCAYVLGLSLVYAAVGLVVARGGTQVRDFLSTWYVRVPLAALFVFLAVVMFAGWNFAVPSSYAQRWQSKLAGKKGLLRTFALGAVSAFVIGPCVTAPLAFMLTYIATKASPLLGFWMLFALGWGMGIPLILFGTATGLLPKAGPWMEWTKRLLGFVLLWAAVYFLWPAVIGDQAYQIAFALLLIAAAVFLGGFNVLTKESTFGDRLKKLLGVLAVAYAVFLFWSAVGPAPGRQPAQNLFKPATAEDVSRAIAAGTPVILDFYTNNCPSCKKLDSTVFTHPEVAQAGAGVLALKINANKERELAEDYGVARVGVPAIFFVGVDGNVRRDLSFFGTKTLDEFLDLLRRFRK